MSLRKRNVAVAQPGTAAARETEDPKAQVLGVRPSPLDGRLTTSTGTRSLDALLAGHAGLALGTSLLLEESGTTDFGGALLRYYAAEGVVQDHCVHVLGPGEAWGRELPAVSGSETLGKRDEKKGSEDRMKIAWRYERLGEFGGSRDRNTQSPTATSQSTFCHDFDLSKRLVLPSSHSMQFVQVSLRPNLDFTDANPASSPFARFVSHLITQLSSSPTSIHRVIIPSLLSPAFYPSEASRPESVLQFLHALRALLRKYPTQLTVVITLPLTLHPRSTGLTRWIELLSDGVLELAPFPSTAIVAKPPGASTVHEEPPQGMLKIHRLPVFHEKGGGGGESSGFGDDLSFTMSRRKGLVIRPFSLPPVEGDSEAQGGLDGEHGKSTKVDIEF